MKVSVFANVQRDTGFTVPVIVKDCVVPSPIKVIGTKPGEELKPVPLAITCPKEPAAPDMLMEYSI